MAKYFRIAFGESGDRTPIPDDTQPGGDVSFEQGFGYDYERDPVTDPLAKNIPRDETNALYFDITDAIRQYQQHGIPDYIDPSENDGVAFAYSKYARVLFDDGVSTDAYTSLVNNNQSDPTDATKWRKGDAGITELTGDVQASGVGSVVATITNNAVTTVKIAAKNVTLAKIENIAARSVLVNSTSAPASPNTVVLTNLQLLGFGDVTTGFFGAVSIGAGLNFVGNVLSAAVAVNPSQLAKAWVNFNGWAGAVIRSAFNVSSVTYDGTGRYTVNFTNPMPNANYCFTIGTQHYPGGVHNEATLALDRNTLPSSTSIPLLYAWGSNAANLGDAPTGCLVVHSN